MAENRKHKVFISYHHKNDQYYKEALQTLNFINDIFIDASVNTDDVDDTGLDDPAIRKIIRDDYLNDSSVTIVLVGTETKNRKHIDWEIYSSMYDGAVNKQSGILVINLPSTGHTAIRAMHGEEEKSLLYPAETNWTSIDVRSEFETRYPYMPDRLIDNFLAPKAYISVANWNHISNNVEHLRYLIDITFRDRATCTYDLSRSMRRNNS